MRRRETATLKAPSDTQSGSQWAPVGEAFEEPVSNAPSRSYQEARFGDGDPFASLKDPSLKLKAEPPQEDYPELPDFLSRQTAAGS
jgi:hypothetical protein